ncbi:hypothetical protein [Bradyrhizobium sp. McL0616]|uniref:hypothetical protein n=1 Tax=Bradyrhizobium sp. McL0616 TaxID=3415674 RepID=UPI003CF4111C
MKLTNDRPYADPEAAARKLIEIAKSIEAVQDGRVYIEKINAPFLFTLKASGQNSAPASSMQSIKVGLSFMRAGPTSGYWRPVTRSRQADRP